MDIHGESESLLFTDYEKLYEENHCFCCDLYRNHPTYGEDETFMSFLENGGVLLVQENKDLVRSLLC